MPADAYLASGLDDVFTDEPRAGMLWEHRSKTPEEGGEATHPEGAVVRSGLILRTDRTDTSWFFPRSAPPGWVVCVGGKRDPELWPMAPDGRALIPTDSVVHPGLSSTLHWSHDDPG